MPIRRYLAPAESKEHTNLQVKMDTPLVEKVKVRMKVDGVSWNELLTACFTAYLEESKNQPPIYPAEDGNELTANSVTKLVCLLVCMRVMGRSVFEIMLDMSNHWT